MKNVLILASDFFQKKQPSQQIMVITIYGVSKVYVTEKTIVLWKIWTFILKKSKQFKSTFGMI